MTHIVSRDEFVELAFYLHGENWRSELSKTLGIDRKILVLELAACETAPEHFIRPIVEGIEQKLFADLEKITTLQKRLKHLKNSRERLALIA